MSQVRIAVVDYGAANMVSITRALAAVGADVVVAEDAAGLAGADAIVVPGVGAAASAMAHLTERGLRGPLLEWARAGRPFLGICLGFQILFESSDEGDAETLGLLPGRTVGLLDAPTLPHIGWNSVEFVRPHPLFDGVRDGSYFYFVHSFAPAPADDGDVIARTTHGRPFVSAAGRGAIYGLQFHPEKSSDAGLRVLSNFVDLVAAGAGRAAASAGASTSGPRSAGVAVGHSPGGVA
jgi:glutamine amidotransferase